MESGQTSWQYDQRAMTMSLVTTGGGLVFGGDANGRFRAFDDETGEVLWEINLARLSPVSRSATPSTVVNTSRSAPGRPGPRRDC